MSERNHKLLVVVDAQERMMPAINRGEEVTAAITRLIAGCRELRVPMLVTEQYPSGLGSTLPSVREAMGEWYHPIEKMSFSACGEVHFMNRLETAGMHDIILCGAETHVCVYQTAMDLRELGYSVQIAADAVGSRTDENYRLALRRMERHDVEITSVEMFLFELMERADIPEFKAVHRLVK